MPYKTVSPTVSLLLICGTLLIAPASAQHFQQINGTFVSVAAGANQVFAIDNFFKVWRFNATKQSFDKIKGAKLGQIAVGGGSLFQPDEVWGQANGEVYHYNYATKTFDEIPGVLLSSITVGLGNHTLDNCHAYEVWGLTSSQQAFRYDYCADAFTQIPGASPTQISTGGGDVWAIDSNGDVYSYAFGAQKFVQVPGAGAGTLSQITVGINDVWGFGFGGIQEYTVYRYDPNSFAWISYGAGGGVGDQVVAGGDGVWVIDAPDSVYHMDSLGYATGFEQVPGALTSIAVGSGAGVWGVNSSHQLFVFVRP